MDFWNQRTFCLITGASRGIGRCIAVEFSKKFGPRSVCVLVGRAAQGLQETKTEIEESTKRAAIDVVTATLDLAKAETADYFNMISTALITTGTSARDFEHAMLVHNAGSVGDLTLRAIELDNLTQLRDYFDLNLLSMILLSSQYFKIFDDREKQRSFIQITSLAALKPFKTMSLYACGKAARDMFARSIAAEDPSISVLSYAPGPVDTEMFASVVSTTADAEVAQIFRDTVASGNLLSPIETVSKLVRVLGERKYTKGEHVDYYEIID